MYTVKNLLDQEDRDKFYCNKMAYSKTKISPMKRFTQNKEFMGYGVGIIYISVMALVWSITY